MAEQIHQRARIGADTITPDDPRYADLASRGSKRFAGTPDYVRLVSSTDQVVAAVQDAVREQRRVAVRSGGHCLEGFVADSAVRVVIDMSLMTDIYYDPTMGAFAIEAGARLGDAYRKLFLGWGVTIPAGVSPNVGGHVLGGGFGFLCRLHGLAADHLYGVEVVVVDATGTARCVVATREASESQPRLVVGAHRRWRRQLRDRHPVLVSVTTYHRGCACRTAATRTGIRADVQRCVELARYGRASLHPAGAQLRRVVRAQ